MRSLNVPDSVRQRFLNSSDASVRPGACSARSRISGAGMAAAYGEQSLGGADERFQGRFQLVSADDAKPISGETVRVRSTGGQYLTGVTDAEGYTQWVERDAAEALAFDLMKEKK